jgi:hypothetical protein
MTHSFNDASDVAAGAESRATPRNRAARKSTRKRVADLSNYPDRWIKAPVRGHCQATGLTRAAFYQLATAGKIKTACIKKPGAIRGNRLFHLGSILAFLDAVAEDTAARKSTL